MSAPHGAVPVALSAALAGRYRLERELGAGGMATVYLAHDLKHDRPVALKVLRPELGAVLGGERFLAEIKTTARLQHPHILPLLDSGEAAQLLYYVMPYVTGETLRERLLRQTQLGVEETLRIAKALAGALDYAHAAGIVHRDLKPENILFQANEPVLADFGIALAVKSAGGARLTETGLSLGTPHYMSPEQATGERGVDARSDVYALGCVVYEMLAGEPPHTGPTTAAVLMKVMTQVPVALGVVRPGLPGHVEAAVMRALAKAPGDRFGSAGAFATALETQSTTRRRVIDPMIVDLLRRARHHLRETGDDYYRRALACSEQAIAHDATCAEAHALKANILASMATGAWSAEVTADLERARESALLAVGLDRELADAHLALALVATYQWDIRGAERSFLEALRIDPALTAARFWFGLNLVTFDGRWDDAREQVRRALESDPLDPMIQILQVWIPLWSRAVPEARAAAHRAVTLFPKWGFAYYALGHALRAGGQTGEAVAAYERAIELDGPGSMFLALLGAAYAIDGRGDAARDIARALEQRGTAGEPVDAYLVYTYLALGERDRALQCLERAVASRASALVWTPQDPILDPLRSEPRFDAFLRAIGLDHLTARARSLHAQRETPADAGRTTGPESPVPARVVPFVGRSSELGKLRGHLEQLAAGHGNVVLLGGEPGVGKTRLAEAVLEEAFGRGWVCLVGHCYEMEGTPAYTPVIEQLEQLGRALPVAELRAVLGDAAPEIARFFPGLRRLLPDVGPPMELPPEQQRQYLHARFREYVERLAARGPVVVLADDLHWADDSSLLLLEALAPRIATLPVLIVGTYRDVELEIGRPFAAVLERLTRQRHAERLAVRRLPEPDVAALLAALGGSPPPGTLVQAIQHETEGNPFFVEEVYAHLQEEGRLFDAAAGWRTDLTLAELEVPEGVKLVLGRRLARVAEGTRAVLTTAAVIGPRFAPALVEEVAGVSSDTVLDALEEAERAGLVRQLGGTREGRYGFAHELIRHTLVSGLSGPRRQRWHLRIADALELVYAGKQAEHAADLAYHLYEAGAAVEPARAIGALLLAAEQTVAAGAFSDSLVHLERAQTLEPDDVAQRADLLRLRFKAMRGLGRWSAAVEDAEKALQLYDAGGDRRHAWLYVDLAEMLAWQGDYERLRALEQVVPPLEQRDDSVAWVLFSVWAGVVASAHLQHASVERHFADAQAVAGRLGDPFADATLLRFRGLEIIQRGEMVVSADHFSRAAQVLRKLGKDWDVAGAEGHLHAALAWMGRREEAATVAARARPLAERVGYAAEVAHIDFYAAMLNWSANGNVSATDGVLKTLEQRMRSINPGVADMIVAWEHLLRFYRGAWADDLAPMLTLGRERPIQSWSGAYWATPFLMMAYRGEDGASAFFERNAEQLAHAGTPAVLGGWWALKSAIEGLLVLGERERAASLYAAALQAGVMGLVIDFTGAFECSTALAAAAGARWDLAEQHFESAIHTVDTTPHVLGQGETRRWYAWMCLERGAAGDAEKALALLDGAQRTYERIGMPKHIEMVHALRARAEQRG